jgi:hypothetical protein
MLHKRVQEELYGKDTCLAGLHPRISRRQIAIVMLMIMIMGSWALDSLHLFIVPPALHESAAELLQSVYRAIPPLHWLPSADTAVASNPIDDSPVTFGSVLLLGVICSVGLIIFMINPRKAQ